LGKRENGRHSATSNPEDFYVVADSGRQFHAFQAWPGAVKQAKADGTTPGFWSLLKALSRIRFGRNHFRIRELHCSVCAQFHGKYLQIRRVILFHWLKVVVD
jgi:hypothetical protein